MVKILLHIYNIGGEYHILSVYRRFSDRVGLPLHNIHIPSLFTSIMDIFFVDLSSASLSWYSNRSYAFNYILHTFLHSVLITFSYHMSIRSQSTTSNESCDRLYSNQSSQFFICCCRPTPPACSCGGIRQPKKLRSPCQASFLPG